MRLASWKADALCVAALFAAVVSFFPDVVLDGGVFFVQDMMVQNIPFRHMLHDALAAGHLPLWEPRINAGFPLLAEGQVGALYPVNWIGALLLSPAQAVTWSVLFHLWAACSGTFLFLQRGLQTNRVAALTGALSFGLSGYLVVRAMSPNFVAAAAGLPFLFLLVESGLRNKRPARIGAAGAVVALQLLAGHPQAAAYGALAAAFYGILRARQLSCVRCLLFGAPIAIAGLAIAAVQVLPTMELANLSLRSGGISFQQFVNMSLPPERLLTLLLPDLFGNSAHGTYWGRQEGFFIQLCPYVGLLTLFLALLGARESRSSARGFFVLLGTLGLLLSLGRYTGFFDLLHQVPMLREFRIPTRFLLWWSFAVSVLAGLGAERLLTDARPLRIPWRFCAFLSVALASVAVLLVMGAGTGEGRELFWDLKVDLLRLMMVVTATCVLFSVRFRQHTSAPVVSAIALLVITWADLRSFSSDFNGTLPESVYTDPPPAAQAIHAHAAQAELRAEDPSVDVPTWGRFRVASLINEHNAPYDWHGGWSLDTGSYERYPGTLRMYSAGLFGLANTMPGWSPLHLSAHWDFSRGYPAWLGLANSRYVVTHGPLPSRMAESVFAGGVHVSHLREAMPRAWVVADAVVRTDRDRRLQYMRSSAFDPHRQVVLEAEPAASSVVGGDFVVARVVLYESQRVVIDLPRVDGYLVLADTYAPGWRVHVDGEEREILRANHVFRAIPVAANDRQVEFDYQPRSFVIGAWISGMSLFVWIVLSLIASRAKRDTVGSVQTDASFLLPLSLQLSLIVLLYGIVSETELWTETLQRLQVGESVRSAAP